MSETNWIALSERKPTEADADQNGYVWVNLPGYDRAQLNYYLNLTPGAIDFMPIPKRVVPPLPKPVEKSQGELDKEAFFRYWRKTPNAQGVCGRDGEPIYIDGLHAGRSEERKRFAAQLLKHLDYDYDHAEIASMPNAIQALHKLLTEAAEK